MYISKSAYVQASAVNSAIAINLATSDRAVSLYGSVAGNGVSKQASASLYGGIAGDSVGKQIAASLYGSVAEQACCSDSIAGHDIAELRTVVNNKIASDKEVAYDASTTGYSQCTSSATGCSVATEYVDVTSEIAELAANIDVAIGAYATQGYHAAAGSICADALCVSKPDVAKRCTTIYDTLVQRDLVADIEFTWCYVGHIN